MNKLIVEAEGLTKIYGNEYPITALNDVNLRIVEGETVAITGPSGSGKSTLLNLIGSLDRPTKGNLSVSGMNILAMNENALADFRRKTIGFVFQQFHLVNVLNALENVMLPLLPYQNAIDFKLEARAKELLEMVGLEDRLKHFPGQLSGGECQRVAVARSLINKPRLILADEPTGNLDSRSGLQIIELLLQFNRELGTNIILATHNTQISERFNRSIHLKDGALIGK